MDIAPLIQQLRTPQVSTRLAALQECLVSQDMPGEVLLAVLPLTADANDTVRDQAVAVCEGIEEPQPAISTALTAYLPTARGDAAYWCVTLLGRIGAGAAGAVDVLATCLERHELLAVRERAAWALGKIGPAAAAARNSLEKAAQITDPRLSRLAKDALDEIG